MKRRNSSVEKKSHKSRAQCAILDEKKNCWLQRKLHGEKKQDTARYLRRQFAITLFFCVRDFFEKTHNKKRRFFYFGCLRCRQTPHSYYVYKYLY